MSRSLNVLGLIGLCSLSAFASPRSAIITLSLPSGARPLGMGEAGLAIAEDVFATSWNPAALALSPLADQWELSLVASAGGPYATLTGKAQEGFLSQSEAWTSNGNQLRNFKSGRWVSDLEISLEGRTLRSVIRSFVGTDTDLDSNVALVKAYNKIEKNASDEFIGKVKLPWSLVIRDTITVLRNDEKNGFLWVGTTKGLLRFDGKGWRNYAAELGDRKILALAGQGATLWVGTSDGLFRYQQQAWTRTGMAFAKSIKAPAETANADTSLRDSSQAPDTVATVAVAEQGSQIFSSLAWDSKNSELWVGVENVGVARLKTANGKDSWKIYNTVTDSIIDARPHSIVVDDSAHVWVGHAAGISHFNRHKWSRIEFDGTKVNDLAYGNQSLWLGTNKGMWRFKPAYFQPGAVYTQEGDKTDKDNLGEWEHYHRGTGMKDQQVQKVTVLGSEIWASTGAGIEHFARARRQVGVFNETLLPSLNIPDLFHLNGALTFPMGDWGTLGGFLNFVSFGEASYQADATAPEFKFNSYEMVGALSYGLKLFNDNAIGTNFKFIYSNLMSGVPQVADAKTFSYAVDLSYLGRNILIPGLHIAGGLYNMGPSVYYVDKNKIDPIPLSWRFGLGYEAIRLPDHRLIFAADYNRETLSLDENDQPDAFYVSAFKGWKDGGVETAMFNAGAEYTWDNLVALRGGYMFDRPGQREEITAGAGVLISDILQADLGVIVYDLNSKGVRQGQWRSSLIFRY